MTFYADSADREAVGALLSDRIVAGVTTNPSILAASQISPDGARSLRDEWVGLGAASTFFQATGTSVDSLVERGRVIHSWGEEVVVKVPATAIGFPAAARLVADGVPVLVTAVHTTAQAVAASAIGASFIAPYLGRLDDRGRDGHTDIAAMTAALAGTSTEVLVASVRTPSAIARLATAGVRHITAAPAVLRAALLSPDSDEAAAAFERAAAALS
ncbi:transaldolase family protein [Microbacterium dauci]|uniref:Transaldolase family protein n=1 Tax=Microbacterium dauci TaxID=3048008 RepID=A0ABT6ZEG0_9MICO|nr:transaldolase family protein [Microbacterium sp. LX3-4]MDJ1114546.1 transaldolase family protein [Microbacterium sp. LX3-4]